MAFGTAGIVGNAVGWLKSRRSFTADTSNALDNYGERAPGSGLLPVQRSSMADAIRSCRNVLIIVAVFSLALNMLMLTVPLYMMQVYDRVLSSRSGETLLMLTLIALAALALIGLLESMRYILLTRAGARLETGVGDRALEASVRQAKNTGADLQGLRDLSQVRQFVASPLICALFDAPVAPLYLGVLFLVHPHLGWIATAAAVILITVSVANQVVTRGPLGESAEHGFAAMQTAQSHARNSEALQAMGMFPNAVARWGHSNAKSINASDKAGTRNALLTGLTRFVRLTLQIAMLGYGAWLVLHDHLSAGIIIASSIISARALAPLDQAIGGWRNFSAAVQAYRRLQELLNKEPEQISRTALPVPNGSVSVEKLIYTPQMGTPPIIKNLSFKIEPGDMLGIVGPSGAGKSTLARLLVGALEPSAGTVRIGGDDIRHWSADALGPHLGYLPQGVELFPATIAENIARLGVDPDSEAILAAARFAGCHELIQRLPNGYETVIGPHGMALSGGQKQHIGLACAFFGSPKIVVLDEPNAHLDNSGDTAFMTALKNAQNAGITCIVVTQRSSVVPMLTKIMTLRDGRIEAFGPKDKVLEQQKSQLKPVPSEPASGKTAGKSKTAPITARFG